VELSKTYTFEASHILPKHKGKCSRLHGHSWELVVCVEGKVNEDSGFVMDYADISSYVKPLIEKLDHRHLGAWCVYASHRGADPDQEHSETLLAEIWGDGKYFQDWFVPGLPPTFYPSSENLIVWIAEQLQDLPWSKLELNETCTSSCVLTRKEYDDRTVGSGQRRSEEVQQSQRGEEAPKLSKGVSSRPSRWETA